MFVNESVGRSYINFSHDQQADSTLVEIQKTMMEALRNDNSYRGALGASVENDHVVAALFDEVEDSGNVEVVQGKKVKKITPAGNLDNLTEVELEDGTKYQTRLVVGSDGANSFTRE